jgi:hypothetical protein
MALSGFPILAVFSFANFWFLMRCSGVCSCNLFLETAHRGDCIVQREVTYHFEGDWDKDMYSNVHEIHKELDENSERQCGRSSSGEWRGGKSGQVQRGIRNGVPSEFKVWDFDAGPMPKAAWRLPYIAFRSFSGSQVRGRTFPISRVLFRAVFLTLSIHWQRLSGLDKMFPPISKTGGMSRRSSMTSTFWRSISSQQSPSAAPVRQVSPHVCQPRRVQ